MSYQLVRTSLILSTLSVSLAAAPALARGAADVSDLVGARGSSGESELEERGYTHISTHEGRRYTKHSYWWSSRDKNCIHVETSDGRYTAITDATRSDCNQPDKSASGAAAVAVGAAIIGALLASKSHHREGQNYNEKQTSEFDRGYRDGLYNGSYHNYNRDDAYAEGYEVGVDERNANLRHHNNRGGYVRSVSFSDIRGMNAVKAIDEIRARGFENVDTITSGNTIYGIYYSRPTEQCVQMTLADDRVYDIRDIQTHPKCR